MTLGTKLINLADFKNNMVFSGPDFAQVVERRTNGADIFIGAIVTDKGEPFPDIDLCGEDEAPLGIVLGFTNRDQIDSQDAGYWYRDADVPFADNTWVYVGILTPGQVVWVCSTANVNINSGEYLMVVSGLMRRGGTGNDLFMKAMESVTAVASTSKYFRAMVVHS